jgi:tRNA G18 (ribose-2'-O)-methylase SpoU
MRGYFGIGIYHWQKACNAGTLFRSAMALGADFVFTVGRKYTRQPGDTPNVARHMPYMNFPCLTDFRQCCPVGAQLVCVEITPEAHELPRFIHPERAIYLLGSEGGGLPPELLRSNLVVKIPTKMCLNVSTAGSIVLYDRLAKGVK